MNTLKITKNSSLGSDSRPLDKFFKNQIKKVEKPSKPQSSVKAKLNKQGSWHEGQQFITKFIKVKKLQVHAHVRILIHCGIRGTNR